jgi:hypothetical protein
LSPIYDSYTIKIHIFIYSDYPDIILSTRSNNFNFELKNNLKNPNIIVTYKSDLYFDYLPIPKWIFVN